MKKISGDPNLVCASFAISVLSLILQLNLGGILAAFVLGVVVGAVAFYALIGKPGVDPGRDNVEAHR